ncbi:MAG: DUF4040 domain-containing protein [Spirochaetaceae bacterium]|nr:MAG: DUF4040 domain-containing protein [Spirochaetaceae bacterium]
MTIAIMTGLMLFLCLVAVYAVFSHVIIHAVVAMSVFSIITAVVFLLLQAPDVAMTEAVIGAGLVTAFFILTLNKIEEL